MCESMVIYVSNQSSINVRQAWCLLPNRYKPIFMVNKQRT